MSNYRRALVAGGCFFFTAVTYNRQPFFADARAVDRLRDAFRRVGQKWPFKVDAMVVLPDHVHCIWRLPAEDSDYATRWRLIKHHVARGIEAENTSRGEKQMWQRRYWEHLIVFIKPRTMRVVQNGNDWRQGSLHLYSRPMAANINHPLWGWSFTRDEDDWRRHMDYIHYNPVRHGYVSRPMDWKHGSFIQAVTKGWYNEDWGTMPPDHIAGLDLE